MGSTKPKRKRPTAAERRARAQAEAVERRKRRAQERMKAVRVVVGDLAIAALVLERAVSLLEPGRVEHYSDLTRIRAFLACASARIHNAAEHARAIHPRIPRQFFRQNATGGPSSLDSEEDEWADDGGEDDGEE